MVSAFVIGFIFIFTFADTMRKIPSSAEYPILLCAYLSLLRIPYTFCELSGYIYLIAATFSLWNLSQSHQITILKSLGKSSKQILLPYFALSAIVSVLFVFVFHPICVRAERLADYQDKVYLSMSNIYSSNLWMKKDCGGKLLYFGKLYKTGIENFLIKNYSNDEDIYASSVEFRNNEWVLKNGYVCRSGDCSPFTEISAKPEIKSDELDIYSIPPNRCGVYSLLKCIMANSSYVTDISKYIINLNKIFSNAFVFFLFSMIAAIVCLPLNRYKTKTFVSSTVIGSAVCLRLLSNICESLGANGSISPVLCVWAPMIISFMLSLAALIWKEE